MTTTDNLVRDIHDEIVAMRREFRAAIVQTDARVTTAEVKANVADARAANVNVAALRRDMRTLALWGIWMAGLCSGAGLMVLADFVFDHIGP